MGSAISLEEQLCIGVVGTCTRKQDVSSLLREIFDRIESDHPAIKLFCLAIEAGPLAVQAYAATKDRPRWGRPVTKLELARKRASISLASDVMVWFRCAGSNEGAEEIERFKKRCQRGAPGHPVPVYEGLLV